MLGFATAWLWGKVLSDKPPAILITSEHGGNQVPRAYRQLFNSAKEVLATHRGYDLGSLPLAESLAAAAKAPLIKTEITRLLVEVNRSPGHRKLFSEFTAPLSPAERKELLEKFYRPHREEIEQTIQRLLGKSSCVIHVGVHTFTPELAGEIRNTDVGLLYDPSRTRETHFARLWREAWHRRTPELRIRRNYPYLGKSDGLVTYLRRTFSPARYLGIELEINQRLATSPAATRRELARGMNQSFADACRLFAQNSSRTVES